MVHDAVGVALDEGQLVLVVAGHCATKMFQPNLPTKSKDSVPIVISPSDHQMLCCGGAPAESRQDQTVQIRSLRMILGTSPGNRGIKQEKTKL